MTSLVNYFLHPMTWLVIGFFIFWWKWSRLKIRARRIWIIVLLGFTYITSTPFLPSKLIAYLEDQFPPLNVEDFDKNQTYRIVVLGGGMGYDDRLPANSLLEPVMLVRLVEGIRVHRNLPGSLLITSGYSRIGRRELAYVARDAAILIGTDSGRIRVLSKPTNTMQEASEYKKHFGENVPVIVVTSAIHMPRAIFLFKKVGINSVFAAPTNYMVKRQNPVSLLHFLQPNFGRWGEIQAALHEIVGMAYVHFLL